MAVDGLGHLFIADTFNNVIREVILSTGMITTIAGGGTSGYDPGGPSVSATAVELDNPVGLALDGSGNLFIADSGYNVIREATPASGGFFANGGTIATIAGTYNNGLGGYGGDGGLASVAQLNGPEGVAVYGTKASKVLLVADSNNNRIREIIPGTSGFTNATIMTVAGDGTPGDAGSGSATTAELDDPFGIAVDGPNLLIADSGNNMVREVLPGTGGFANATIMPFAGNGGSGSSGDGGLATSAQLASPQGLAVDDASGDVWIADSGNNLIRKVYSQSSSPAPGVISTVVGGNGGLIYASDIGLARNATLANPDGIVVDPMGDVFIADENFSVVREIIASTGKMITIAGTGEAGALSSGNLAIAAELDDPAGLALDAAYGLDDLFIADSGNNEIREINLSGGTIKTVAGNGTSGYSGDGGTATSAELDNPTGVEVDSHGDILIADTGNNLIREVLANGTITTVAGGGSSPSPTYAGPAAGVMLSGPADVAFDPDGSGDFFISDTGNDVIREVVGGMISTLVGAGPPVAGSEPTSSSSGDGGPPTSALLSAPSALVVDSLGDIDIADSQNNAIRQVLSGKLLAVAPAPALITVSDPGGTYDGQSFPATATVTGLSGSAGASLEGASPSLNYFSGTHTLAQIDKLTPLPGPPSQAGSYTVEASFAGSADYASSVALATFAIAQAIPIVSVSDSGGTYDGKPFPATATVQGLSGPAASSLEGVSASLTYYRGAGITFPLAGPPSQAGFYTVVASFAGSTDYTGGSDQGTFTILKATPQLAWATPSPIPYGTPLGAGELDATSGVPGTFAYSPAAGTIADVGNNKLSAMFAPGDATDYTTATTTSTLTVTKANTELVLEHPVLSKKSVVLTAQIEPVSPGASVPTGTAVFELLTKKGKKTMAGKRWTVDFDGGDAILTVSLDTVRNHPILILYGGDSNYQRSTVTSPTLTRKGLKLSASHNSSRIR